RNWTSTPVKFSFSLASLSDPTHRLPMCPGRTLSVWWARQDLNLGPTDYESAALTAELRAPRVPTPQFYMISWDSAEDSASATATRGWFAIGNRNAKRQAVPLLERNEPQALNRDVAAKIRKDLLSQYPSQLAAVPGKQSKCR